MERTGTQKLAGVLKVLVTVVFVCNLIALFLVPGLVLAREIYQDGSLLQAGWQMLTRVARLSETLSVPSPLYYIMAWILIWLEPAMAVLALFLWACGICTAVILWQARRVLGTIRRAEPFCRANAVSLKRAAVCCFVISGAALARTVWSMVYFHSGAALLTYNALFVPVFLVTGLVCLVMSALFRQAAELKEDNDLTI